MKKCLNCGRDNPDENKFCYECGTMLPVIDSDEPSDLHDELFANHENESSTVNSEKQSAIPETKPETIDTINATPIPKISFPATLVPTREDIKKIVIALLLIAALIAIPLLVIRCLNSSSENSKKYVYHAESGSGSGSYFEVDFSNETYKYVGSNIYGNGNPAHGFFKGGSLEISGSIAYRKTINGVKCYSFYNNPWEDFGYLIAIDETKGTLTVHMSSLFYYEFKEEK